MTTSLQSGFALVLLIGVLATAISSIILYLRRSPDLSSAGGSVLLSPGIRGWHYENLRPFEELMVRRRVKPSTISLLQLVMSVVVGAAYATGLIFIGGWLLLLAGSIDIIDGRVARRLQRGSKRGAFLDSVIDRYVDSIAYLGLAAFYAQSWMLWWVLLALVGGYMVSYTRARAEGLGATCLIGLLQRPERYVILGLGSIFGALIEHITSWHPWGQLDGVVVLVLIVLAVLSNVTAVQRAVYVMKSLPGSVDE